MIRVKNLEDNIEQKIILSKEINIINFATDKQKKTLLENLEKYFGKKKSNIIVKDENGQVVCNKDYSVLKYKKNDISGEELYVGKSKEVFKYYEKAVTIFEKKLTEIEEINKTISEFNDTRKLRDISLELFGGVSIKNLEFALETWNIASVVNDIVIRSNSERYDFSYIEMNAKILLDISQGKEVIIWISEYEAGYTLMRWIDYWSKHSAVHILLEDSKQLLNLMNISESRISYTYLNNENSEVLYGEDYIDYKIMHYCLLNLKYSELYEYQSEKIQRILHELKNLNSSIYLKNETFGSKKTLIE